MRSAHPGDARVTRHDIDTISQLAECMTAGHRAGRLTGRLLYRLLYADTQEAGY